MLVSKQSGAPGWTFHPVLATTSETPETSSQREFVCPRKMWKQLWSPLQSLESAFLHLRNREFSKETEKKEPQVIWAEPFINVAWSLSSPLKFGSCLQILNSLSKKGGKEKPSYIPVSSDPAAPEVKYYRVLAVNQVELQCSSPAASPLTSVSVLTPMGITARLRDRRKPSSGLGLVQKVRHSGWLTWNWIHFLVECLCSLCSLEEQPWKEQLLINHMPPHHSPLYLGEDGRGGSNTRTTAIESLLTSTPLHCHL